MKAALKSNPFLLAILCAFLGGLTPVAAKIALEAIPPFTLVFLRFLSATMLLLPFLLPRSELSWAKLRQLWWVGLLGALNPVLLFIALPFTQASVSPLIYASVPALTAVYLFLTAGSRLTTRQVTGIIVGFAGVAIVILFPFLEQGVALSAFTGNLLIFGAAIAFMLYGVFSKRYQSHHKISPLALTFYFCLITMLAMVPLMLVELGWTGSGGVQETAWQSMLGVISYRHLLAALATGILGSGMFYLVYQWALAAGSEVAANLFTYLQPVATILMAVVLLGESVGWSFVIGGVLAVIGAHIARK